MPWSPLVMAYLMWFDVVYTNTPLSSHVPDFTLKCGNDNWNVIEFTDEKIRCTICTG